MFVINKMNFKKHSKMKISTIKSFSFQINAKQKSPPRKVLAFKYIFIIFHIYYIL